MGATAAAIRAINGEYFDLYGHLLYATREVACDFCIESHSFGADSRPAISFSSESRTQALRVHAQLTICDKHLTELAGKAKQLAPEPWNESMAAREDF